MVEDNKQENPVVEAPIAEAGEEKKNEPNLQKDPETGEMVSKTELKKRVKAREAAVKKAKKAEE